MYVCIYICENMCNSICRVLLNIVAVLCMRSWEHILIKNSYPWLKSPQASTTALGSLPSLGSTWKWDHTVLVPVSVLLQTFFSRLFTVQEMAKIPSFKRLNNASLCICGLHFHFSSIDGLLGCWNVSAILNSAAINMGAKIPISVPLALQKWNCWIIC